MDMALFEQLLYEEESTTLDFKLGQYAFVKASDDEKSELLKDILGFVNAWRRSDAYILIGVEDVRGGRARIVGINDSDQLDDHSLQQFVNNLTDSPVRFHYRAFSAEGKQIGIIRIEQQPRPVCLKRDYGKLKRNEVYVRRGSSTDPTKPATPKEIAQMGHAAPEHAEVAVQFAEVDRDQSLGECLNWNTEFCGMPATDEIPDLVPNRSTNAGLAFNLPTLSIDPLGQTNSHFFREMAEYEFARRLLKPVRLSIVNTGRSVAKMVQLEVTLPLSGDDLVVDQADMPDPPKERREFPHLSAVRNFRSVLDKTPGRVTVDRDSERIQIEVDCGDLQPGRQVWSETFFIGRRSSGELVLRGRAFAENLPSPSTFDLSVAFSVAQTRMSVDELCDLPEPPDE